VFDAALAQMIESTQTYARIGAAQRLSVAGDVLSNCDGELLSLASGAAAAEGPVQYEAPTIGQDDPVSILYTSGSTGFPKGCVHSHLYWLVLSQCESAVCVGSKRILLEAPYFYMMGPTATLGAMWRGRSVFTAKRPSLRNFMNWIDAFDIDSAWVTVQLLNDGLGSTDRTHDVRFAFTADIPGSGMAEFEQLYGISPRQCYGMTEIGFGTMVPWDDPAMSSSGSIGIPGPLRECKLIDEHGADVLAAHTSGELCVRGIGIFSGYYNKPAVNAEVFLDGGWFRTGDIARRDEAGSYFFMGRAKDMIRRSDENIASREVEDALMRVAGVVEAAVVPVKDDRRGEEVKAYLILRDGENSETISPQIIAAEVGSTLAAFKIPRYFEYRAELPRTASDKVSKPALIAEKTDLRADSYDFIDSIWR
jgi:acyl-coenzyme A synthetase/AMP-(fatty) acid ligase